MRQDTALSPHPWPWLDTEAADQSDYWAARTVLLTMAATLTRWFFIARTDLTDTEAYYIAWSRFPAWSYYDHPPLVAWLVGAMHALTHSLFAVRFVPLICAALLSVALYQLGERLFSARAGFIAALIITATPTFVFIGFLVNPEGPLHPLWVWYLVLLYDLREKREPWRPLVLGVMLGLAFLSKYTGLLLLPITIGFVATTPKARWWLRRPTFYLAGLVAFVVAAPVIFWNATRGWPTLHLHFGERMPTASALTLLQHTGHFVLTQWLGFHPLIVPAFVAALVWTLRQARTDDRFRLLAWASAPVLAIFAWVMIRASDAESHWTAVAYLSLAVAVGAWLDTRIDRASARLLFYVRASLTVTALMAGGYFAHTQTPLFAQWLPGYDAQSDPANETQGWDAVRAAVRQRASELGTSAVVGSHNVLCGHLLVALDDDPHVYCASPRRTEFDFLDRREPASAFLYVDNARYTIDPATLFPDRTCHDVEAVDVRRGALSVGRFRIAACSAAPAPVATR